MIVEDETSRNWLVLEGDPAYTIVDRLYKKGMKYIALPQSTLRTGDPRTLTETTFDPYPALKAAADTEDETVSAIFLARGKRFYQLRQAARLVAKATRPYLPNMPEGV